VSRKKTKDLIELNLKLLKTPNMQQKGAADDNNTKQKANDLAVDI